MNGRIFFWSLTSALAGFLFGFDTVVISGAEKTIQSLWGLSAGLHGIAMASALLWHRGWFAAWGVGRLTDLGAQGYAALDRHSLLCGCSGVRHWRRMLLCSSLARVIGGLGIGISTVVAPMYISEIAPAKHPRTTRGNVSVQYCFWHPDRFRLERAAGGALARMPGAGCWAWRRFRRCSMLRFASGSLKAHAGCWGKRRPRGRGSQVLQRIEPDASPSRRGCRGGRYYLRHRRS